jgi:hypothetical protein
VFDALRIAPAHNPVTIFQTAPSWNYTTYLNLGALAVAAFLGWRFFHAGGVAMLTAMENAPGPEHEMVHDHHGHHHQH